MSYDTVFELLKFVNLFIVKQLTDKRVGFYSLFLDLRFTTLFSMKFPRVSMRFPLVSVTLQVSMSFG